MNCILRNWLTLLFTGSITALHGQVVTIPDTNLDAVVRLALQKPTGPLTEEDMLGLSGLSAGSKQIISLEGLETARNLSVLDLDANSVTNFSIASALTNLSILDLFENDLTDLNLSNASLKLFIVDTAFNSLSHGFLPDGLTNLDTLFLEGNVLTNFNLPTGLIALTQLDLSGNSLANLTVRPDMTNLRSLTVFANQLTNLTLPANLNRLVSLDSDFNQLSHLDFPAGLTNFSQFLARNNQLTNLTIPADMTNLGFVDLAGNHLSNLTLPAGSTHLNFLRVPNNQLTSLTLPGGMTNLSSLFLQNNQLTNVTFPAGLSQLAQIDLTSNNLTSLILPPDMTNLSTLGLDGNPLITLVMSEPLAVRLSNVVASLENKGINVYTYPLTAQLFRAHPLVGAFQFALSGPPAVYTVLASTNLVAWSPMITVSNPLGKVMVTDGMANLAPQKFYRTVVQPPNLVFIAPNTFMLGSPTNEAGHQADESPQTVVTLSHGFWMGEFPVTQHEYVAVMASNPSNFPADLNRPVDSVSWFDATNYCDKLTQQDLAAGRIPAGSHYRLPTEAEWECAARAGTTTRFYHGDDATNLTNYAWYSANSGFGTHAVGLKQPNAWGLYDMEGDVWEWCQDWYGPYPGGSVTDPQGPANNPIGFKVIRGGGWDSFESDCRSARRDFRGASPFITDFILGFRVVLTLEP